MAGFKETLGKYSLNKYFQALMALGVMFGMSGFIFGRSMITVSYIHFGTLFLIYHIIRIFKPLPDPFKEKCNHYSFIAMILLALPAAIGCLYSTNSEESLHVITLRAQLLLVPLFFWGLPAFQKIHVKVIFKYFIFLLTFNTFFVLQPFTADPQQIIDKISVGKSFSTPISHIRYSVLAVLSAWFSFCFSADSIKKPYKIMWAGIGLWLSIFIHILAVKTGLLLWYTIALFIFVYYIKVYRFNRKVMYGILGLFLFALIAFTFSSPLKQKINYFIYDMQKYLEGSGQNYSDSERLYAIEVAWSIFKENPLLGTGTGDFAGIQMQKYREIHPSSRPILPHSDWVTTLAANGIAGLAIFAPAFFLIFLYRRQIRYPLFMMVFLGMLISTLVDNLFATSAGTAMFVFYTLTFLSFYSQEPEAVKKLRIKKSL